MKYLLDTHTLLWWLEDNPTLSRKAKQAISSVTNSIFISAVSAWEITIKKSLKKLEAPDNLEEMIKFNSFISLPITIAHTMEIGKLPHYHDDPFDRLLIAQAQYEKLTLITRDTRIIKYDVTVIEA
jgi:PIN domain nuclease of toxin-antitoxin system